MLDFTLKKYKAYLVAIKSSFQNIITFEDYLSQSSKPESFCIIRHDIDRKPGNALKMAILENELGIKASYYFRIKKDVFSVDIIQKIAELGHEIGYHYESLSDTNGNIKEALTDFEINLKKFRTISKVKTISMHGRPFKPYDNRDMWKEEKNMRFLKEELGILGELYLDIDYTDIAYINDTGRNWDATKSNLRDKTNSKIDSSFNNGKELFIYFQKPHPKMIFQVHPERWSNNGLEWLIQFSKDALINIIKLVLSLIFKK